MTGWSPKPGEAGAGGGEFGFQGRADVDGGINDGFALEARRLVAVTLLAVWPVLAILAGLEFLFRALLVGALLEAAGLLLLARLFRAGVPAGGNRFARPGRSRGAGSRHGPGAGRSGCGSAAAGNCPGRYFAEGFVGYFAAAGWAGPAPG